MRVSGVEGPVGGLGALLVSATAQEIEYRRIGARNRISVVIGATRSAQ